MEDDSGKLQLDNMFGPVCEEDVLVTELYCGTPSKGTAALGEFAYYRFSLSGQKKLVTILVKALGEGSDCDIYVSEKEQYVTKGNYTWKSPANYPMLQIHPIDPFYSSEYYYIGIYGVGIAVNNFEVSVILEDPVTIYELTASAVKYTVPGKSLQYFVYKGLDNQEMVIQNVCAMPGPDKVSLYGAWDFLFPRKDRNQVASNNSKNGKDGPVEYDPFILDETNTIKYMDTFDPSTFKSCSSKDSVAFKLNSYNWKNFSNRLYISLENLAPDPVLASIKVSGNFMSR